MASDVDLLNGGSMAVRKLTAPFPWFGGKSGAASLVWAALGDVPNYVEPFFGSGAVLLARPHAPRLETVNDLDCYLVNFWRAVKADPAGVAEYADYPVSEADLTARHQWLVDNAALRERVFSDPEYYDVKAAGWWVWGQCAWIGQGWCDSSFYRNGGEDGVEQEQNADNNKPAVYQQKPYLGSIGRGVHRKKPHLGDNGRGVHRKKPHLSDKGNGVHSQKPYLSGCGMGVHRKKPHLGNDGMGVHRKKPHLSKGRGVNKESLGRDSSYEKIYEWMLALQERLRKVRICCGSWERVLTRAVTTLHGVTGVFLDPPYATKNSVKYSSQGTGGNGDMSCAQAVARWAFENGDNPDFRIVLCGYEGEHKPPKGWRTVAWKASVGYQRPKPGERHGGYRERLWLSPHCVDEQKYLFDVDSEE